MKHIIFFFWIVFYFSNLVGQEKEIGDYSLNSSIRGWNEWENQISETTLRFKLNSDGENSFIKNYKIKSVEKLRIILNSNNKFDSIRTYLIEYDSNGLLLRVVEPGKITSYCYDSSLRLTSVSAVLKAFIERATEVEILPNIETRYYDNNRLIRKELYLDRKRKPYKIFYYDYTNNQLLQRISIFENKTTKTEMIYKYTFFK